MRCVKSAVSQGFKIYSSPTLRHLPLRCLSRSRRRCTASADKRYPILTRLDSHDSAPHATSTVSRPRSGPCEIRSYRTAVHPLPHSDANRDYLLNVVTGAATANAPGCKNKPTGFTTTWNHTESLPTLVLQCVASPLCSPNSRTHLDCSRHATPCRSLPIMTSTIADPLRESLEGRRRHDALCRDGDAPRGEPGTHGAMPRAGLERRPALLPCARVRASG